MTTAFALSGGASLGAVQVGMLQALHEAGIGPDLIVGTSVGAVNGAWIAGARGRADLQGLADLWRSLRRGDVFPSRGVLVLRACARAADRGWPSTLHAGSGRRVGYPGRTRPGPR